MYSGISLMVRGFIAKDWPFKILFNIVHQYILFYDIMAIFSSQLDQLLLLAFFGDGFIRFE